MYMALLREKKNSMMSSLPSENLQSRKTEMYKLHYNIRCINIGTVERVKMRRESSHPVRGIKEVFVREAVFK